MESCAPRLLLRLVKLYRQCAQYLGVVLRIALPAEQQALSMVRQIPSGASAAGDAGGQHVCIAAA